MDNMFLRRITICRENDFGYSAVKSDNPLRCTVEVVGPLGKTELTLPESTSDRIIAIIADELAASARQVAEVMTAKFVEAGSSAALPAP